MTVLRKYGKPQNAFDEMNGCEQKNKRKTKRKLRNDWQKNNHRRDRTGKDTFTTFYLQNKIFIIVMLM